MNVRLHIGRVVLDEPLAPSGRRAFQAALQSELTRLVRAGGLSPAMSVGGAVPSVPVAPVNWEVGSSPARLGTQLARTIYGGLGNPAKK